MEYSSLNILAHLQHHPNHRPSQEHQRDSAEEAEVAPRLLPLEKKHESSSHPDCHRYSRQKQHITCSAQNGARIYVYVRREGVVSSLMYVRRSCSRWNAGVCFWKHFSEKHKRVPTKGTPSLSPRHFSLVGFKAAVFPENGIVQTSIYACPGRAGCFEYATFGQRSFRVGMGLSTLSSRVGNDFREQAIVHVSNRAATRQAAPSLDFEV